MYKLNESKKERTVIVSCIVSLNRKTQSVQEIRLSFSSEIELASTKMSCWKCKTWLQSSKKISKPIKLLRRFINKSIFRDEKEKQLNGVIKDKQVEVAKLKLNLERVTRELKEKTIKMNEKTAYIGILESKLQILETERKNWNIVLDHHGEEIDINLDKVYILDG